MIQFIEAFCRVPDGPDVGKKVALMDFQKEIIHAIYDDEDEFHHRVVREAVLTMGRKNGKTQLASMLVLAHLIGPEALRNSRIYSAAYDREQASIVYNAVANMVMLDRYLNSQIKLVDTQREARWYKMGVNYKALSAESRTKHGLNPAFVILDELAQFGTNRNLYDVLKTSMGVQAEPLMLVISTQPEDDTAMLSQLIDYGRQVESGDVDDPSFKLFEYMVPEKVTIKGKDYPVDIYNEENWLLANPALGAFRLADEMRQMARRAKLLPTVERKFRNLYLNQRVSSSVAAISAEAWAMGHHPLPPIEVLRECRAFMAVDLSSKLDMTAICIVFELPNDHWAVWPHFFTPEETMHERTQLERIPYVDWHGLGFIEATKGSTIDYTIVCKRMLEYFKMFNVVAVAYDRWRMDVLKRELNNQNFDWENGQIGFLDFGQGFKDMSPAMETLEQLLLAGKIMHGGHPILKFNVGSAVAISDEAGNRKLDKRNSRAKIDGMVAMVMALHTPNRLDELGIIGPSIYEKRGIEAIRHGDTTAAPPAEPQSNVEPDTGAEAGGLLRALRANATAIARLAGSQAPSP